jgi:UDP-N-acetylglucosamine--N-acetylmuramyl-(pentapeptide) pyrophosphoryl-undecaprenol N-acetylglucosamine transferase
MKKDINVLLTGGHAGTTALAVIEEIQSREDTRDWKISWIGAKQAVEGKKTPTLESQILPKLGISTHAIIMGRLQRRFTRYTLASLVKIPFGFVHAFFLLKKIKPQVILSFGGFAAYPVVVIGSFLKISVAIHDQTAAAGRANMFSAKFAKKIAISRVSSEPFFPKEKIVLTGNPIIKSIRDIHPRLQMSDPPVLFVAGGSRGSQSLNTLIRNIAPEILRSFIVIHQTGTLDYRDFVEFRNTLSEEAQKHYELYEFIDPLEIHTFWRRADIFIGRAGANTVSESIAAKRPSIFIPLPFAYNDEQTKNAEYAKIIGLATIIPEKNLDKETFLQALSLVHRQWGKIVKHVYKKQSPDKYASTNVVNLLKTLVDPV